MGSQSVRDEKFTEAFVGNLIKEDERVGDVVAT